MFVLDGVTKYYRDVRGVEEISLTIRQGEFLGLVGPNGSGKSTLLKIMLGLLRPNSGRILFNGEPVDDRGWRELRRRIGYMPERISFYDNLTGLETLRLFARIKGCEVDETVKRLLPGDALRRRVGGYSKGMRQRLNLAQALMGTPDILVLDEPTSGLDPSGRLEFYSLIEEIREQRVLTVVLSTHLLAEVEERVDRVVIMRDGRIKAEGSITELYKRLNLPLKVYITVKGRDTVLEDLLRLEGARGLLYKNGYLIAEVPPERKMSLLGLLMEKRERFEDIEITEPSLEEVFFGIH